MSKEMKMNTMRAMKPSGKHDGLPGHQTHINPSHVVPPPKSQPTPTVAVGKTTVDILNDISPPREFMKSDILSSAPALKLDIVRLQELLDRKLQQRKANEMGICTIRRELYSQCFDELIRQITISCSEMGLLLLQIRNELQSTMKTYRTLYESGVASGMRKFLQVQKDMANMEKRIADLENERDHLREQLDQEKAESDAIERSANKQPEENEKLAGDIKLLKRVNEQLKIQLREVGKEEKNEKENKDDHKDDHKEDKEDHKDDNKDDDDNEDDDNEDDDGDDNDDDNDDDSDDDNDDDNDDESV